MNQNDVKAFLTIAKTGSLNQAANLLFVTQPALSQQLKTLEAELGATLFNRKKGQRTLSLTSAGRRFFSIAQKYDALYTESMQLKQLDDDLSLSINAVGSLNSCLFPPLYINLATAKPSIALTLSTGKTTGIYQNILAQKFDIGLVHRNFHLRDLDILPIFQEELCFVCAKEYAQREFPPIDPKIGISPDRLDPRKEIYFSWSAEYNSWHEHWLGDISLSYMYIDQLPLIEPLLLKTDRWAIVPASALTIFSQMDNLSIIKLSSPPPPRTCYAISSKGRLETPDEAVAIFMRELQALLSQNSWIKTLLTP